MDAESQGSLGGCSARYDGAVVRRLLRPDYDTRPKGKSLSLSRPKLRLLALKHRRIRKQMEDR